MILNVKFCDDSISYVKKDFKNKIVNLRSLKYSNSVFIAYLKELENQIINEIDHIKDFVFFRIIQNYKINHLDIYQLKHNTKKLLSSKDIDKIILRETFKSKQKIYEKIYDIKLKTKQAESNYKYILKEQQFKYNQYKLKIKVLNNILKSINKKR